MFFTTLRKQRRRHRFTQDEVAFLLGGISGSKVSRYECSNRIPSLQTAIALQIIYGVQAEDLFPDMYRDIQDQITRRVRALLKTCNAEKRSYLETIIEASG